MDKRFSRDGVYTAYRHMPDLWIIEEESPVAVRTFLFIGDERALLIDAGCGNGDLAGFVKDLTDLPVTAAVTHSDHDHMGGISQFEDSFMSPADFYRCLEKFDCRIKPDAPKPLWEGEILNTGKRRFEVISLPGHTPGSVAFLDRENRLILTGDYISGLPVYMFAEGRSIVAYRHSLLRLRGMRTAFDKLLLSHGPAVETAPDILDDFVTLAEKVISGEQEASPEETGLPARVYRWGRAAIYYD